MLGRHEDCRDACRLQRAHPLAAVQLCRIEYRCGSLAVAFVDIVLECIYAEMDKCNHLAAIPFELPFVGCQTIRLGCGLGGDGECEQ